MGEEKLNNKILYHYKYDPIENLNRHLEKERIVDLWFDKYGRIVKQISSSTGYNNSQVFTIFIYDENISDTFFEIPENIKFEKVKK